MATEKKSGKNESVQGVVTARKCGCCGHHEIGLTTPEGKYIPLKPGMQVRILPELTHATTPRRNKK